MKLHTGLNLLLFVALTHAAPRSPAIVQVYEPEQEEEEPLPIVADIWPQGDVFGIEEQQQGEDYDNLNPDTIFDSNPILGSIDLKFDVNEENVPLLLNDTITNIIFKDLEHRIAEDVKRMQEDFFLFQRLFGHRHKTSGHRPSWFLPWGHSDYIPEERPAIVPDYPDNYHTNYDYNPMVPNNENDDEGNFFSGYPFIGLDRPLFPGLTDVPGFGFANPENLPDNYNNKTHEVHSVNGTKVVVNNTINKESGDNFNSFFHHQVIHIKPQDEGKVPQEEDSDLATEAPELEIPQDSDVDGEDVIPNILPEVENEVNSGNIDTENIPEVNPDNSLESIPEDPVADHEEFENNHLVWQHAGEDVAVRSLDEFHPIIFPADDPNTPSIPFSGPKSAAYISNRFDIEDPFEEIDIPDEERRAPDLSKDTRVNRIHANKQGMTRVDPDAEIFNYGLVMREAQPRDDDK